MQQENSQKVIINTTKPQTAGVMTIIAGFWSLLFAFHFISGLFSGGINPLGIGPVLFGFLFMILGLLAITGGIFTLIRKNWIVSLIGAIASIFPLVILGILAIVLIILSKKEFSQPV